MADNIWLGREAPIAQVGTFTVTAYDAATTYTITIGSVSVSVVGSGGTTTTVATALTTALNASAAGQFSEITWSSAAAIITATADTAGTPFTATSAESGGTGTIGDYSATTANASPNDVNDANNWSAGTLPADAEDIYFNERSNVPVYWNLDALSGINPNSVTITAAYTEQIGLKSINDFGTAYPEYRARYLQFDAEAGGTPLTIGQGIGQCSGMIRMLLGSTGVWTITVFNTASSTETARQAVSIYGPSTNTVLTHVGGSVGIAELGGETMTIATLTCGPAQQGASTPDLILATGCTLTTVSLDQAQLQLAAAVTTLNHKSGTTYITGSGAITTLSVQAGLLQHQGTGTITTLRIGTGATMNFGAAGAAITVTNAVQMYSGAAYIDPTYRASLGAGIVLNQCRISDVTIDIGSNRTLTPS